MITFIREQIDENTIFFKAEEDGVVFGECTLLLKDTYAEISSVSFNDDSYSIAEGLLKSASFYAANRNYYMCRCTAENIDRYLAKMNFTKKESFYESDIPSILIGCCGNCNK